MIVSVEADGAAVIVVAVATGLDPSGHVSGGITYVNPSSQQIAPGGTQAKRPGQAGIQPGVLQVCRSTISEDLSLRLASSLPEATAQSAMRTG